MSRNTGVTATFSRVLITGPPRVGKTTICKKLASKLKQQNYRIGGFYTEEIRDENNIRIGFDVVLIKNPEKRSPLARSANVLDPSQHSKHRVGNYDVFLKDFEAAVLPVFSSDVDILFVDEIGKMELCSQSFHEKVSKLFRGASEEFRVIATIPEKPPQRYYSLFEALRQDERSKIINVTRHNRDSLPEEIIRIVS